MPCAAHSGEDAQLSRETTPGLAVQLANAESIFPHLLARAWRTRGLDSIIVSATSPRQLPAEAGAAEVVDASLNAIDARPWLKRTARQLWAPLSNLGARQRSPDFQRQTGLSAPQPWETVLVPHLVNGWRVARAAMRLSPRLVFGHEVMAYGFAVARCAGVPRILFPWGADIMTTAEVSPWHFRLVRYALNSADLIVPSSTVAARHLCSRFGIDPSRVKAISWGADLGAFRRLDGVERRSVCAELQIDADQQIVMSVRRFLPLYNCGTVITSFLEVARERPSTHFVLLGGLNADSFIDDAARLVSSHGPSMERRFTFLRSEIPVTMCARLMGVADVAVSLCGRGDMRSRSVLEAAAAGGALVLSDSHEYRSMVQDGFAAELVDPVDGRETAAAILRMVDHPDARLGMRVRNQHYLATNEDAGRQMDRLLEAILSVTPHARRR
jgi:glycosyltransferase involved in cell wall biosynthesis